MAREIKFRGKDILTDKWVYGDLLHLGNAYAIVTSYEEEELEVNPISDRLEIRVEDIVGVYPETAGQFTGLLDKNGKEIYEGDIIKTKRYGVVHGQSNTQGADLFRVVYKNAQFYIDNKLRHFYLQDSRCNEVIGNVFDNPELLKAEAL